MLKAKFFVAPISLAQISMASFTRSQLYSAAWVLAAKIAATTA
jgi:hypothetical protein